MSSHSFHIDIGLEVHAQLLTKRKIFCFAPANFGSSENSQVGAVSAGLPGSLPVMNKQAVKLAVQAGLALNCRINTKSVFARKNYFYPDLPKGYQISQFDLPICSGGAVSIELDGTQKIIELERIHMEEDAGKSTHIGRSTLVNLNRSGVPLVEIVSQPQIHSATEAVAYLKSLHSTLVFVGVTDGNMEEGNFRCDVNISVRPNKEAPLGTRSEIKNMNSFRFVEKAIEYEAARQIALIQNGEKVIQETRGWDSAASKTYSMRSKEEAHDYRYFPDPDLPPLVMRQADIDKIRKEMPELPEAKRRRYASEYGLTDYDSSQLILDLELAHYFEECVAKGAAPKTAANWILGELLRALKNHSEQLSAKNSPVQPEKLCQLIEIVKKGEISGKVAKTVFHEMFETGFTAPEIVKKKNLGQISDEGKIETWAREVIKEQSSVVEEYRNGNKKLIQYLMGQVLKKAKGKANPQSSLRILEKIIGEES